MSFLHPDRLGLRRVCPARASIPSAASAMLVGLAVASLGLVAFAEPVEQAAATPTPSSAATCAAPPQGLVVTIDNPGPGAVLSPDSNVVVTGVAYDTASTSGTGVDRVSVFLGDREAGGIFWGDATLGAPSPGLGGNLANAGYSRRSPSIPTGSGGRDIFVYAHSSVTNREAASTVPVFIGAAPTAVRGQVPTAVPTPLPVCTPTPTPPPTAAPTAPLAPPATPLTPAPTATLAVPAAAATVPPTRAPATATAPAAPATVAPAAMATPAPAAATQTTAPRGGGVPVFLGLLVLAVGAGVLGGGVALRRRERRGQPRA